MIPIIINLLLLVVMGFVMGYSFGWGKATLNQAKKDLADSRKELEKSRIELYKARTEYLRQVDNKFDWLSYLSRKKTSE